MTDKTQIILDPEKIPAHLAVIMDGNGRWAKKRLMNRVRGHEKGVETARVVVRACREIGIPVLTLYAFSSENWGRPKAEVTALMGLFKKFLLAEREDLMAQGIRLKALGEIGRLPSDVRETLLGVTAETRDNTEMTLNLALSYGSRGEIVETVKAIADKVKSGRLDPSDINEGTVGDHLYTAGLPDPDLMIRTSGEQRISNFLLWQIAYAEISFTKTLWPDFSRDELLEILLDFQSRERRFGKV